MLKALSSFLNKLPLLSSHSHKKPTFMSALELSARRTCIDTFHELEMYSIQTDLFIFSLLPACSFWVKYQLPKPEVSGFHLRVLLADIQLLIRPTDLWPTYFSIHPAGLPFFLTVWALTAHVSLRPQSLACTAPSLPLVLLCDTAPGHDLAPVVPLHQILCSLSFLTRPLLGFLPSRIPVPSPCTWMFHRQTASPPPPSPLPVIRS